MKYQSLVSFEKHLQSAAPDRLCQIYLIAIPDDFERMRMVQAILSCLKAPASHFQGSDCDLRAVLDGLQTVSLLGESIVVLDETEKLNKKQVQTLSEHLNQIAGYFILASRGKTPLAAIVEQRGVVLDLLEEKPWEKEKRLTEQLMMKAKRVNKKFSAEAAALLFERLGIDAALLDSELDKLICYVADRAQITREDILQISPASKESTLWQTAEEVIWEKGLFSSVDTTAFHGLIPSLRHQLHIGLTLATLIEEKCPSDQWNQYLPKLWPKILEKRSSQAARYGSAYFRKGLDKLFEVELVSRTHSTQYQALLDSFWAALHGR